MGFLFFGILYAAAGAIESIQEEIRFAKAKREYDVRRWRMKNRWIA